MTDAKRELISILQKTRWECSKKMFDGRTSINLDEEHANAILEKFVHKDEILDHVEIDEDEMYLEITDWQTKHEKLYGNTGILQGHRKYLAKVIKIAKPIRKTK